MRNCRLLLLRPRRWRECSLQRAREIQRGSTSPSRRYWIAIVGGVNSPSFPLTSTGSIVCGSRRIQAYCSPMSSPSPSTNAAPTSAGVARRTSTRSATQSATPRAPSLRPQCLPRGSYLSPLHTSRGPRYVVDHDRSSIVFNPSAIIPAQGCLTERAFIASSLHDASTRGNRRESAYFWLSAAYRRFVKRQS